jgi:hypothetical protein
VSVLHVLQYQDLSVCSLQSDAFVSASTLKQMALKEDLL